MRRLQCALLAAVAAIGFASVASAADMPVKAPVMVVPVYNWTGFYIGVNAGGAWNQSTWTDPTGANPTFNTNASSFVFGGHAGYNYQMGQAVVGVEGDIQGLHINASNQCSATVGSVCNTTQNALGSIRARLGYAGIDRALFYVTGGVAFTRYSFAETALLLQNWGNASRTGWTAGGGIEYAVWQNWIVGAQYSYYDFGTKSGVSNISTFTLNFKETESVLTARLSYKF
jgi:outer membrane immunogenic protein